MYIVYGWKTERAPGPDVAITCPKCGQSATAESYERIEHLHIFFVPVIRVRNTFVECGRCGKGLLCRASIRDLPNMDSAAIAAAIAFQMSSLGRILTVLSLLTFFVPGLGALLGIGAYFLARHASRGWRIAASAGMALGVAVTATVILLVFMFE